MTDQPTNRVDVLILGAGAAGMMAAVCAAAYGIDARVIDKRPEKIVAGHADGLMPRTMETLASFDNVLTHLTTQGSPLVQGYRWEADGKGNLRRTAGGNAHLTPPPSPFNGLALSQARIQDILYDYVCRNSNIRVERNRLSEQLSIEPEAEYPVKLRVRQGSETPQQYVSGAVNNIRLDDDAELLKQSRKVDDVSEIIQAKYVVACDGAHSWTRRQLNIPVLGDDTDVIWGVVDIMPITDFPTPRAGNLILSEGDGLMWIPRERSLVRVYCVLTDARTDESGRLDRASITEEMIVENIRRNLRPYKISYKYCEWWAAYQIGQRVATDNMDQSGRVMLAGDAVKTHSPKAGQGMNTAITDSYNLMWKLSLVLKGFAKPSVLETYRTERLPLAQRQVNFDRLITALASGKPPPQTPAGLVPADVELSKAGSAWMLLINGLDIIYPPSDITMTTTKLLGEVKVLTDDGKLPKGIVTGMRMPIFPVRRQDNNAIQSLGNAFHSEGGCFRIVIFAGDITNESKLQGLHRLAKLIEALPRRKQLLDVITVHTADPLNVDFLGLPEICHPFDETKGYDYSKVFYDEDITDHQAQTHIGSAYTKYDIDPEKGLLVLLRPDQYVACSTSLEDPDPISKYFDRIVVPQTE